MAAITASIWMGLEKWTFIPASAQRRGVLFKSVDGHGKDGVLLCVDLRRIGDPEGQRDHKGLPPFRLLTVMDRYKLLI